MLIIFGGLVLIGCLLRNNSVFGSRILFIPAHNINSHTRSMYPVADLLAADGHEVTVLQLLRRETFDNDTCKGKHVVDRYIWAPPLPPGAPPDDENFAEILWTRAGLRPTSISWAWVTTARICKDMLHDPAAEKQFRQVIAEKWDLVAVDDLMTSPCGMAAVERIGAPWIVLSTTFLQYNRVLDLKGIQPPPSYVPTMMVPSDFDSRKFFHRLISLLDYFYVVIAGHILEYLPWFVDHPLTTNASLNKFQKDSVLAMGVLPVEMDFGKPLSNDVIDYDNDCSSVKSPLPEKYSKFVEDPTSKGTIIMSLGHYADWDNAPHGVLDAFCQAFNELKDYRIVWQFVSLTHRTKPTVGANVMITHWIPQMALLAHNRTLLFITHAGLKSIKETMCFEVPVIGMPMFAEQGRNAAMAIHKNFGLYLDKTSADKISILSAINEILNNDAYKKNVTKLNAFLNDKILNPTHAAKFWMNFVLEHGGETVKKHMKLRRPDCLFRRHFLDFFGISFILLLFMFVFLC